MKAYRVTTPNEGTRYTKSIDGVLELLDNDGWDWLACGPFHRFIKTEGVESHVKYSPSVLRHLHGSGERVLARMLGNHAEGFFYQYDDNQYMPESEIIERAYITIEVINM